MLLTGPKTLDLHLYVRPGGRVPQALDRWEDRLEALFDGRPYDILDAALTDTVARFPVHIQVILRTL